MPQDFHIIIPGDPISVNQAYRTKLLKKGRASIPYIYKTAACRAFQKMVSNSIGPYETDTHHRCIVTATWYFSRHGRDVDNPLKPLLDALKGYIFKDDKQINELHIYKNYDKKNPRTELAVTWIPNAIDRLIED